MEKNHETMQTGLPRYLWNAVHHFRTINRHKREVMKNCFRVGLYRQGLLHDLSKYSWAEFKTGVKYYQGYRSPNTAERLETGLCEAWLTTSSTGSTTTRKRKPRWSAAACHTATSPRCSATASPPRRSTKAQSTMTAARGSISSPARIPRSSSRKPAAKSPNFSGC